MVPLTGMEVLAVSMTTVEQWIQVGGPFALFGILFACGLGLPLPEDIPLTIAGFMVAQDDMNLIAACIAGWCGIIGGDLMLYHFGRKFGLEITRVPFIGKHVTVDRIRKAEGLFARYGIWVVAVGRLFAGIRGAMVIAAGATRFNLVKFIIADGLAALVSGGLFLALGHWAGKHFDTITDLSEARKKIAGIEHWVIIGLLGALLLVGVYIWWRKKNRATLSEKAMEKAADHVAHTPTKP